MPVPISNLANKLGALEHAKLTPKEGGEPLELMFNPESLVIAHTARWTASPSRNTSGGKPSIVGQGGSGGSSPAAMLSGAISSVASALGLGGGAHKPVVAGHGPNSYQGSPPATLAMDVHFNDSFSLTGMGDISTHVARLEGWMHVPKDGPNHPPLLTFTWGKIKFLGYLSSLSVAYMHFGIDGSPVHAKASIRMTQEPDADGAQNPTSGGPAGRRTHRVCAGDSLQLIAYREYGSPTRWRTLAEANGIDDPLRLRPGVELLVPLEADSTT